MARKRPSTARTRHDTPPAGERRTRGRLPAPARARGRDTVLLGTVLGVLVLLALVIDDRHVGLIADGRQMIRTAVALAETGGIGQARGRDFTIERAGGDAISRFGMATSLLQVPAAWVAARVEPARGPGSSQSLFLVLPWLSIAIAGAAAGVMARRLGASDGQVVAAVLLATLASPLASYAALEFSEPLQAAALSVALASSLAAAQSPSPRARLEFAAGLAAGWAVLTKSSLLIVAPAALLPLVDVRDLARTRRSLALAGAGAAVPLAVWAAFEIVRFGRFFGGYPDDRFTHPWLDGAWRLIAGPNRGLLLFWPALVLFAWTARRWDGRRLTAPESRAWLGALAALVLQVAIAAGYWGWHGMEGWGPRLIVAALPLLAPFAAVALAPSRGPVLAAVVALSILINLPPLLQHPTPVATYVMNLAWPEVPEQEAWRYPFYASARSEAGRPTVVPFEVLESEPAANPWRVYLWFWRASRLDDQALAERLQAPPWRDALPDLVPPRSWPPAVARQVAPRWQPGFLGRSLTGTGGPYARVYAEALLDQVVLANQMGDLDRALALSDRVLRMNVMDGEAAAWRLETLRRTGRALEAEPLLRGLPDAARRHPLVNVALALFDRDFGEEARARALLRSVASSFPGAPLQQALTAPLATWPATLDAMVAVPRRDAAVEGQKP